MLWRTITSIPWKDKKSVYTTQDFDAIIQFLWNEYRSDPINNWNDFLISERQPECAFSDHSDLKVQEYIDTILSKYSNLTIEMLDALPNKEGRLLNDMLLRMNLRKLQSHFWDYILYYLVFEASEYGRYESYLKEYCNEHLWFVKKYWRERLEMIRNAWHRLGLQSMSFVDRMNILRVFITIQENTYTDIIQKYLVGRDDMDKFSVSAVYPRTTMPWWFTKYWDIFKRDIHKNELRWKDCYLDAPLALILYFNGEEIAVIAGMLWHKNQFVIHQMQTVSSKVYNGYWVTKPPVVAPITHEIKRQEILFDCLNSALKSEWITDIYIQPWDKNEWTKKMHVVPVWNERIKEFDELPTNIPHLSQKIAYQIYDVFAQKIWYVKDKSWFWRSRKKPLSKKKTTSKHLSSIA